MLTKPPAIAVQTLVVLISWRTPQFPNTRSFATWGSLTQLQQPRKQVLDLNSKYEVSILDFKNGAAMAEIPWKQVLDLHSKYES
jgi:hypothetical protein